MKPTLIALVSTVLVIATTAVAKPVPAFVPTPSPVTRLSPGDRLLKVSDRMVVIRHGVARPLTAPATLANGSQVTVDGVVVSKTGSRVKLPDCGVIGYEGKRLHDTTARVLMIDGQLMVLRDGVTRRIEMRTSLGGGRTVTQEGYLIERNGTRRELPEGTLLAFEK
ncbi:DUF6799 domain-containing protein [Luteolibacter sp. LG18]|uniref:DUF6799 domain-containing protein n=1 Tax=Luteolibacter sp. LG18 TaxID=2819286 RepID=UPI002B309306|nr:hypothetical protein llg_35940 [Luteolibacter sp. LG18]